MYDLRTITSASFLVVLVGCSKSEPAKESTVSGQASAVESVEKAEPTKPEPAPPPPPAPPPKVELEIGAVGSTMKFDKTSLTVPAGSEVHLVLKNAKPGNLGHNWVLVNVGKEAAVAAAGLSAGPKGNYVTAGPDVLAFTPLAQPGTSSEVTFQAPPEGTYPYICSFPGHYLMMKGTFVVTASAK